MKDHLKKTIEDYRPETPEQKEKRRLSKRFTLEVGENEAKAEGYTEKRITSKEQLVEFFNIDLNEWKIKSWQCGVYESHTKLRKYAGHRRVDDEHRVVPLYKVSAVLIENKPVKDLLGFKQEIIRDIKQYVPKGLNIIHLKDDGEYLFEPDMPDIHFGKLAWAEESGDDYDVKIAREFALKHLSDLIDKSSNYKFSKVLFPIGHDFFNVDNAQETTTRGTKQQEDTRWKKTYKLGRVLCVDMINMLTQVAPVDVVIIPGNHDTERAYYLGDSLECWFHNSKNVTVNNGAKSRKYYRFGNSLIGLTHGYSEKLEKLPLIMPLEQPKLWAETKFHEWQTGDKHHKKEIKTSMREDEGTGVMVRILRSLSANDTWHCESGYVGQVRGAEAFIRHKKFGLVAQITSFVQ